MDSGQNQSADALVFFGATGDLAYKQIFPALQAMVRRGHLDIRIIGVASTEWGVDELRGRARDSIDKHGGVDEAAFAKLASLLQYVQGDYADPNTYTKLRKALGNAARPLYYMAIPPSLFATVAAGLAKANSVRNSRVIIEKPFGRDLESARALSQTLHEFFPETAIFRIDHYLGKEPVQNLTYFRFANLLLEASWNNRHIESVQITMAEHFGVAGRGKFYEEAGAIRDVVQNHLLEVIACLGMECPAGNDHEARREERQRLLQAVRPLVPADVVRGQFRGYRNEPGVAADSQVETFAALRFYIDNERWQGVPFYVRAGKCLPVTATEVLVQFKRPERAILDEAVGAMDTYCRLRFSPECVIALGTMVKKTGELMVGEKIELIAHHQPPGEMAPYERLLSDAKNGDATLFARQDSVETSWQIIDPILATPTPLYEYDANTWGPEEVEKTLTPEGGWHNPKEKEVECP
jgi:glucose-6-phosphate 1-dehydrogenase